MIKDLQIKPDRRINRSQKLMIFFLSMPLFGLSDIITKLIPTFKLGPIKIGISYFSFVSLTLCMLLDPFYAALGSCFGKTVFGDILMGDFNGIGKLERFIEYFIAMFIAGLIVKNPKNKTSIVIASLVGIGIDRLLSGFVDVGKILVGIDLVQTIPGFGASAVLLEVIGNIIQILISGVLLGVLPALYLVPRLNGKLEPLLGIEPRNSSRSSGNLKEVFTVKRILTGLVLMLLALISQFFSKMDNAFYNFLRWDPGFTSRYAKALKVIEICSILAIGIILFLIVFELIKRRMKRNLHHE